MKKIELHCDGCALSNPHGQMGAGVVLIYQGIKKEWDIALGVGSNNRAELLAVIEGLKKLTEPCDVTIYSDSLIIINCILGVYQRSANRDLWDEYEAVAAQHKVVAIWNKKDSTEWNRRCHDLANKAAYRGKL